MPRVIDTQAKLAAGTTGKTEEISPQVCQTGTEKKYSQNLRKNDNYHYGRGNL
jgi:hypothetical protein